MEKKTIRSGAPFVFAGAGVMAVALTMGLGSFVSYPVALAVGAAGYALGRKKYPDRVIEVETAPKSGNAEVDALLEKGAVTMDEAERDACYKRIAEITIFEDPFGCYMNLRKNVYALSDGIEGFAVSPSNTMDLAHLVCKAE